MSYLATDTDMAEARFRRAIEQRDEYSFELLENGGAKVRHLRTGRVYIVDAMGDCTCPDSTWRGRRAGVVCKHGTAARLIRLERGE